MKLDVVCLGEMVIDFIPGDQPGHYIRNAGGAPANAAIAIARNRYQSGFIGKLGNDDFGHFLVNTLEENNVKYLLDELSDKAITTLAFVTLDEHGDRSFTFARKPGADMLLESSDVNLEAIENCKIFHAGSCSLSASPEAETTIYAIEFAKSNNKLVSFDYNYRELLWSCSQTEAIRKIASILKYVDMLKLSEEETDMLGGREAVLKIMEENKISLVVETLGAKGAIAYYDGSQILVDGLPGGAVDSTGAGDAFWGSFIARLLDYNVTNPEELTSEIVKEAMSYGNVAGTLCVREKGAISSLPTREQITEYIRNM